MKCHGGGERYKMSRNKQLFEITSPYLLRFQPISFYTCLLFSYPLSPMSHLKRKCEIYLEICETVR